MLDLAMEGEAENMEAGTPESCCPHKQHISQQLKLRSNMSLFFFPGLSWNKLCWSVPFWNEAPSTVFTSKPFLDKEFLKIWDVFSPARRVETSTALMVLLFQEMRSHSQNITHQRWLQTKRRSQENPGFLHVHNQLSRVFQMMVVMDCTFEIQQNSANWQSCSPTNDKCYHHQYLWRQKLKVVCIVCIQKRTFTQKVLNKIRKSQPVFSLLCVLTPKVSSRTFGCSAQFVYNVTNIHRRGEVDPEVLPTKISLDSGNMIQEMWF